MIQGKESLHRDKIQSPDIASFDVFDTKHGFLSVILKVCKER